MRKHDIRDRVVGGIVTVAAVSVCLLNGSRMLVGGIVVEVRDDVQVVDHAERKRHGGQR